ncbi:MAG: carboxylating nicotinate-nucleotide diphosphorylase [Bacteroidia bacterium]|nr:carboxylating nicotinate-nucleotide diphosphorylase [Bacteroidia bacterium]QQR95800.1 MAG: carboxylating nicotinate-nucleotide diphosphorylase [Bacteroidota bacterium]MBP7715617.1 carboxylating nicotinate-nucleotide diphosphorylase [Bacteroidia bacterium]MBP8668790.1 carboxylating nicotinate-nucleotide diphosphorylase [Bacteroidia bacterium]HOZ82790.1 carboxylating nicotinate-nucleotide diphosphorylase [Bacteroidia bacterium]
MDLDQYISLSLQEDVGPGDYSALSCIPADAQSKANLIIKDKGILAGIELAEKIFKTVDASLQINIFKKDGQHVDKSEIAFTVEGSVLSILKTERLVLNCMQRMSGIASTTYLYAEQVKHTKAKILDTRKTTPLNRYIEKWAVRIGGGHNHRFGLYDMIMIKDNHVDYAGGIKQAIESANTFRKNRNLNIPIEIETRNLNEVEQVLNTGCVERIMLDNFQPALIKEAVSMISGRFETEASGGIILQNVKDYAETGVDYISVGALTHSFKSMDMSLKASQ